MGFDRFLTRIIVRVALSWLLGTGGLYLVLATDFWLAGLWLLLFALVAVANLVQFTYRYRRGLQQFLEAIKQRDFSQSYPTPGSGKTDQELKKAYKEILQVFRDLSSERESQHHFLNAILAEVGISLVVLDQAGDIVLHNPSFSKLVGKKQVRNINSLAHLPDNLLEAIKHLGDGEKSLVRLAMLGRVQVLSVQCSGLVLKERQYRILTFQDIRAELDEKELDAWQKLIRILTHEIMNSAIPVATLTSVTRQALEDKANAGQTSFTEEDLREILQSLRIIESRSKGLAGFVDAYRSMTSIKPPTFSQISIETLFQEILRLLQTDKRANQIDFKLFVQPKDLVVLADKALLEQVLINLANNAIDALEGTENPIITMSAAREASHVVLTIADNGSGMAADVLDNIFIPFYTTKEKGSGIGLSLSRQIVRLHGGTLTATSEVGLGSKFEVRV